MTAADGARRWSRISLVTRQGRRLAALFGIPPRVRPPVVVLAHRWGSSKECSRNLALAQGLWEAGMASLLPDLTAHGQSDGRPAEAHPDQWADDLHAAVAHLGDRDEVDGARIGLACAGLSSAAALVAAANGLPIRALVLRAPLVEGYAHLAPQVHIPTLILQGGDDPLLWSSRVLADSLGPWGHLVVVPGAGHRFDQPEHLDQLVRLSVAWLQRFLCPTPPNRPFGLTSPGLVPPGRERHPRQPDSTGR